MLFTVLVLPKMNIYKELGDLKIEIPIIFDFGSVFQIVEPG